VKTGAGLGRFDEAESFLLEGYHDLADRGAHGSNRRRRR
jgi:hypothetical protein